MDDGIAGFFSTMPQAVPIYAAFEAMLRSKYPDMRVKVQKTQISISNKHGFAWVWLPIRKMKGRPEVYMIISFGLPHRDDSPRIVESLEDLDEQLIEWIDLSYRFSSTK